jgi:glycosyltransferase involved in cell wall biosynthesis
MSAEPADLALYRPLLIAEAANPEWASVPLVGWSLARALLDRTRGHLVTQVRNREAVLRTGLIEGVDVTFIDSENVAAPLYRLAAFLTQGKAWTLNTAISALAYYEFERQLWKRFGERVRQREFDLVHRITPLSPVTPSLLSRKCQRNGIPFVLGPLNGGVPWPREFRAAQHQEWEWLAHVRSGYKLLPGYRSTRSCASAILVASQHTLALEPAAFRAKCVYLPENAVDPARFNKTADIPDDGPLKVCFVGRLVPYKGIDMLLDAAWPLVERGLIEIDVIGDGPLMPQLRASLHQHGSPAGVRLHGRVAHHQVQDILAANHVLGFPSIREFGGGVVLEAMALGVVPMVVDYAGPAELVTDSTGIKIPLGTRVSIVAGFRAALESAQTQRARLRSMSTAGKARVQERFTWAAKAAQVLLVYDWVTGRVACKPSPMD